MARQFMFSINTLTVHLVCILALLGAVAPSANAADLNAQAYSGSVLSSAQLREEVTRRAALYLIRSAFDVLDPESVSALLSNDVAAAKQNGVSPEEMQLLDEALTAEGSYYIVSLSYLNAVEGAAWPGDRPAFAYSRDASVMLSALQQKWLHTVSSRGDLLPILRELDTINGWTEGYTSLPARLDHFSQAEALVDAALEERSVQHQP